MVEVGRSDQCAKMDMFGGQVCGPQRRTTIHQAALRAAMLGRTFVLDAVDQTMIVAMPTIWNSDKGSHYTSPLVTSKLEAVGGRISMDGSGWALNTIGSLTARAGSTGS
ncbi:MAG: hypothetical protein AAGF95_06490 [Chloroflexota bacterium]